MKIRRGHRMGHDYDIEEKIRRTLYSTSIMMYDKGYNHISNSIPGSMSQKIAISSKNRDFGMRTRRGHRKGHDYNIEEKMQRTLHFTPDMMYDKAYNHISNSIPGSMSQK